MVNGGSVPEANGVTNGIYNNLEYTPTILDSYTSIEIGLPRGTKNDLYHPNVKKIATD